MPSCLFEMEVCAPHTPIRPPTAKAGDQWRALCLRPVPRPLGAVSPRLGPAPSGHWQSQWACCLFSEMAPRHISGCAQRPEGWVVLSQPEEQWPF